MSDAIEKTKKRVRQARANDVNSSKKSKSTSVVGTSAITMTTQSTEIHHQLLVHNNNKEEWTNTSSSSSSKLSAASIKTEILTGDYIAELHSTNESDTTAKAAVLQGSSGSNTSSATNKKKDKLLSIQKPIFGSPLPLKKSRKRIHDSILSSTTRATSIGDELEQQHQQQQEQQAPPQRKELATHGTMSTLEKIKVETVDEDHDDDNDVEEERVHIMKKFNEKKSDMLIEPIQRGSSSMVNVVGIVMSLLFLWIGSIGLLVRERMQHESQVVQLRQELEAASQSNKDKISEQEQLLDRVEKYKKMAADSESKLQGCKWKFQDLQSRLEKK